MVLSVFVIGGCIEWILTAYPTQQSVMAGLLLSLITLVLLVSHARHHHNTRYVIAATVLWVCVCVCVLVTYKYINVKTS
jgi:hypothetical protein